MRDKVLMTRTVTGTMCAYWIREFEFEIESNSDFHFTTSTSRDSHIDSVSDSPIPIPTRCAFPSPSSFPHPPLLALPMFNPRFEERELILIRVAWHNFQVSREEAPPSRGKKVQSGAQEVHRLGASGEISKTNDERKQNERIINMENVDSCRRRRKWWLNFRSTTQCATQIWQSDRLHTPPLLLWAEVGAAGACLEIRWRAWQLPPVATAGQTGCQGEVGERNNQKRQWGRQRGRGKWRQSNSQEYVNYERLSAEIL